MRNFTNQPVSDKEINELLDAATRAPSAGNIQPWEFIVVRKPEIKHGLSQAALDQEFIEQAPAVIVVCTNPAKSAPRYGSRGIDLYCLQDAAAATQNILLAAQALGLGTCWVGAFKEEMAKEVLKIPEPIRPVAIIPVGHAVRKPSERPRKALLDVTHRDIYGQK